MTDYGPALDVSGDLCFSLECVPNLNGSIAADLSPLLPQPTAIDRPRSDGFWQSNITRPVRPEPDVDTIARMRKCGSRRRDLRVGGSSWINSRVDRLGESMESSRAMRLGGIVRVSRLRDVMAFSSHRTSECRLRRTAGSCQIHELTGCLAVCSPPSCFTLGSEETSGLVMPLGRLEGPGLRFPRLG